MPTFTISNAGNVVQGGNAAFTVTMFGGISAPYTIWYSTLAGSASAAAGDYPGIYVDLPLTFNPGGPTSQQILIPTLVEPGNPPGKPGGGRRRANLREAVNALIYVLSTGCQWRTISKDLPPKSTVYGYFDLWTWDRTLDLIHHALHVTCRERFQKRPFRVRQIAWQTQPLSRKLLTGGVSPHLVPSWLLRHTHESQVIDINQFFSIRI